MVLNSLIIIIKIKSHDTFQLLWPNTLVSSKPANNKDSNLCLNEPIDLAVRILCQFNYADYSGISNKKKQDSSYFSLKINAINFLNEFVKCEPVRRFLEL